MKLHRKKTIYSPEPEWILLEFLKLIFVALVMSYVFFDSFAGLLAAIPFAVAMASMDYKKYIRKRKAEVREDFKELLSFVSGNLNAGYSLENAFLQAGGELRKMHEREEITDRELKAVAVGISCNRPIEELLDEFGAKTEVDEIQEFADLIKTAKKYGGNIIKLIRIMSKNLTEKCVTELEIKTMTAAKKMEGMIMLASPVLIIAYMRITNGGYISMLYETSLGRILMTICLGIMGLAGFMINKIVRIEV